MRQKSFYKNGKIEGKSIGWYENGQKHFEDNYEDGLLDGYSVSFRENGSKKKEENYKHGFCLTRTNHVEG
jgi:antitoxin component YwqK of YwqJK toxin-antitoxin module